MAKIFLSPLIVDIRAKQSDTVFSKWRGLNYIRSRVIPANPRTSAQQAIRNALTRLVSLWKDARTLIKTNRNYYATGKPYSGFNTFLGDNIVNEKDSLKLDLTRDNGYYKLNSFSMAPTATAGELTLTWDPEATTAIRVFIVLRKQGATVWDQELILVAGTTTTLSGLESGVVYQGYALRFRGDVAEADLKGNEVGDDLSDTATPA
jgi:hypothetical protein